MGEVYLAQDLLLNRKVAIKFLSSNSVDDERANERLLREARAAATLEHQNICSVYDTGEANGQHFIVMQYIEGETLAARLQRGRLSLKEALNVAIQVADALVEAHAHSIVHRDIKPANIMINSHGKALVLDFGLAKWVMIGSEEKTQKRLSPSGSLIGTITYMSPEQARQQPVDERTDVWSLGVVLYEMVVGRNPFARSTPSDCLAAILTHEPPLDRETVHIPVGLQHILKRALQKERGKRHQTADALLLDLKEFEKQIVEVDSEQIAKSRLRRLLFVGAVGVGLLALVLVVRFNRTGDDSSAAFRYPVKQFTLGSGLDDFPAISPDGKAIAYCSDQSGSFQVYVKALTPGAKENALTFDSQQNFQPAWSPDSQQIAYYSKLRGGIWIVAASGGEPRRLTDFGSYPAWSPDGTQIVFQSNPFVDLGAYARNAISPSTLWLVSAKSGETRQLTDSNNPIGGHGSPAWSPNGKRIAFEVDEFNAAAIWTVSANDHLDVKCVSGSLQSHSYGPVYAPDGQSVYYSGGETVSQRRVDPDTGEAIGEPAQFIGIGGPPSFVRRVSFSADGTKIAYSLVRRSESISSVPLEQKSATAAGPPILIVSNSGVRNAFPSFSPDGNRIAFVVCQFSDTGCHIWLTNTDGSNQKQLTTGQGDQLMPQWFSDMTEIAFVSGPTGNHSYWAINLETKRERVLADLSDDIDYARLSPDDKQIVFNCKRGVINVCKSSLPSGEPKQLTFDEELMGFPEWSPDGKLIAFQRKRGDDSHIMVMPNEGGTPTQLTFGKGQSWNFGWSPKGDKILFAGFRHGFWNVWWVSLATKTERRLTDYKKLNSFVRYPAWSPKGDQVAYEYSETTGNIWLMELK